MPFGRPYGTPFATVFAFPGRRPPRRTRPGLFSVRPSGTRRATPGLKSETGALIFSDERADRSSWYPAQAKLGRSTPSLW